MVDGSSNDNAEANKRIKKAIPKDYIQQRSKGERRKQYNKAKSEYQTAIKTEKTISWKKHCTATSPTNPWTEVYKIAAGKTWTEDNHDNITKT